MTELDDDKSILAQPLRRVMELIDLREGDIVLVVSNCPREGEEDAQDFRSEVTVVASSCVEKGVHFAGSIWTVRLESDEEDVIYADVMDPKEPANGVFASGGGFWANQLYLLLSAAEIQRRRDAEVEVDG